MSELPIFNPVVINNLDFIDLRNFQGDDFEVAISFVRRMLQATTEEFDFLPRTILCECSANRRFDKTLPVAARLKAAQQSQFRRSVEDFDGERDPVTFLIEDNQVFFGAWQLYSIEILQETISEIRTRASFFPSFPFPIAKLDWVELAVDLIETMLDTSFALNDGRTLEMTEITSPTITDESESTQIVKDYFQYLTTKNILSIRTNDPRQLGRQISVLKKRPGPP